MSRAYYNEIDPKAAAWLRELISHGHIAPGDVDTRSIKDVTDTDLKGYTQCHFFAGIGGWSLALRLAGWPDDHPVWTGSCPCQPFSAAGLRAGKSDDRHLWPWWYCLIAECQPSTVFGEQVASAAGLDWLDEVSTDLETEGYAVGAADLCAAGVGAPHIRQRLWFVADAAGTRGRWGQSVATRQSEESGGPSEAICNVAWPDGRGNGSTLGVPDVLSPSYGIPARMGRLRGYGNAIVPQVAQAFIAAYVDTL